MATIIVATGSLHDWCIRGPKKEIAWAANELDKNQNQKARHNAHVDTLLNRV